MLPGPSESTLRKNFQRIQAPGENGEPVKYQQPNNLRPIPQHDAPPPAIAMAQQQARLSQAIGRLASIRNVPLDSLGGRVVIYPWCKISV